MINLHDFLQERFEEGGFTTEDALSSFLPLARQVAQTHAAGKVAPLDGIANLQVEGIQIWFNQANAKIPVYNNSRIRQLDKPHSKVEILSEQKRTLNVDEGPEKWIDLQIGNRDQEIVKPVYLPGYISWEHGIEHHDPISDIFCLGMILASLTCCLDFNQPEDLQTFVGSRRNLFQLTSRLHPVLAKAIVRMTELSRHNRPQDLPTIISNLEQYRDQNVDFDFSLASAEVTAAEGGRKQVILGKLQERLFEISRRNRLLHFRPTLQSVNLTHASVPLSFHVEHIRPEQILTWTGEFARTISQGGPVSLNHYLNFSEQIYIPSVLDRIRAEAVRDTAEFGFEQLRLAICFLRWWNVKADPPEPYDSPLILLPVRLIKKKGVRDRYVLQPLSSEAEINPVIRHLFKQWYGIDLPVVLDLEETTLPQFYTNLADQIAGSEPGIALKLVDRPRIDLIHDQARRRLDRYRRNARLSGRNISSFLEIDYSYDAANLHPLGLALFRAWVRPNPTHLREIVQEKPEPRRYLVPPPILDETVTEKEKQFYTLREEADNNPYHWDLDLCRLTLGNFKYRKMTLVRDYSELSEDGQNSAGFDAIFSLSPRPLPPEASQTLALEERFPIVACDPTQSIAISQARTGVSYIVQGPPGTGKSQTITNLIADYIMNGKKVLFVCEKRAAIDVVYVRLRQCGLHKLCCLIHDSQTDKKEFILDLKTCYEELLAEQQNKPHTWQQRRQRVLQAMQKELSCLEDFNKAMLSVPAEIGIPVQQLLERTIEICDFNSEIPLIQAETLPDYVSWYANREIIAALVAGINEIQSDGVLANHPMAILNPAISRQEHPAQFIDANLQTARQLLHSLTIIFQNSGIPQENWYTMERVKTLTEYATRIHFLKRYKLLDLLDDNSVTAHKFSQFRKKWTSGQDALCQAAEITRRWHEKLPAEEVVIALDQAKLLEGRLLSFINPSWWRLRKVLKKHFNFAAHSVKPTWTKILSDLNHEYQVARELCQMEQAISAEYDLDVPVASFLPQVQQIQKWLAEIPSWLQPWHEKVLHDHQAGTLLEKLIEGKPAAENLQQVCESFLEGFTPMPLSELQQILQQMEDSRGVLTDYLYCLDFLARLPENLAKAFRTLPLNPHQLEAVILTRNVEGIFFSDRILNRFNGNIHHGHVKRLAQLNRQWQEANAGAVLEKARQSFLEHIRIASLPAAQLTSEQKEFKAVYNRGRRELEHEFGKVMRHKSIRDIVGGESALVVSDLKPVWLMSPLSVSDTLPLRTDQFDVVIFDEASQIPLEEAVPSIFRSEQTIVVGDEMQLPPTDFFSAKTDNTDEEGIWLQENGQMFEYDLSSNSFLNHAAKNLPARMLGWHYRSRSESLISFSNWAFYQGKLLTVPDIQLASLGHGEIIIKSPADGVANAARLLDRPVSFHFIPNGIYENRRNRDEADYIARLVRGLILNDNHYSCTVQFYFRCLTLSGANRLCRL